MLQGPNMVADCGGHPRREMTSESSTVSLGRAHDIGTKTALHAEPNIGRVWEVENECGGRTGRADGNEPIRAVVDMGDRGGGGAKGEDCGRSTATLIRQEKGTSCWARGSRPDEGIILGGSASVGTIVQLARSADSLAWLP